MKTKEQVEALIDYLQYINIQEDEKYTQDQRRFAIKTLRWVVSD